MSRDQGIPGAGEGAEPRVPRRFLPPRLASVALDPLGAHAAQAHAAAVLMVFGRFPGDEGPARVILTKRTATVKTHKSQIGFPGGHVEPGDATLIHTAIRETTEEVGIPARDVTVHGALPTVYTPDGKAVHPFWATTDFPLSELAASPREVQEIILVPWTALARDVAERHHFTLFGVSRPTDVFHYEGHVIWGLTARIIVSAGLSRYKLVDLIGHGTTEP